MTFHLHLVILAIALVVSTAIALLSHRTFKASWAEREGKRNPRYSYLDYDKESLPSFWVRGSAFGLAGTLLLSLVVALIPFAPKYWVLTEHEGTIASISNRFVDGTGDVSGITYTLTLEGDQTPRVVSDSRILALNVGDPVSLTCSLEWVYGGADRSNCYMRSF